MPKSKKRHHSHPQQHHDPANKPAMNKSNRVVKAAVIFFTVLGLLISYFIAGPDIAWLLLGTALGAVAGYFFGRQMNKTFSK